MKKKSRKKSIVIWTEVWDDFDTWYQSDDGQSCASCGHVKRRYADWDEQKCQIEEIVEKQLARR